jgi:hypothetical protein
MAPMLHTLAGAREVRGPGEVMEGVAPRQGQVPGPQATRHLGGVAYGA